jgi:hypothetical protein
MNLAPWIELLTSVLEIHWKVMHLFSFAFIHPWTCVYTLSFKKNPRARGGREYSKLSKNIDNHPSRHWAVTIIPIMFLFHMCSNVLTSEAEKRHIITHCLVHMFNKYMISECINNS